jgi:hypothetical protein
VSLCKPTNAGRKSLNTLRSRKTQLVLPRNVARSLIRLGYVVEVVEPHVGTLGGLVEITVAGLHVLALLDAADTNKL